jgi:hypothetical protein
LANRFFDGRRQNLVATTCATGFHISVSGLVPTFTLRLLTTGFQFLGGLNCLILLDQSVADFDTTRGRGSLDALILSKSPLTVLFKSILLHNVKSVQYPFLLRVMIVNQIDTPKHCLKEKDFARQMPYYLGFLFESLS